MDLGYNVIGIDWTVDPKQTTLPAFDKVTLQGNLDPCALYSPPEHLKGLVRDMIEGFQRKSGYIVNLGHGIYPDMDPEAVKVFIDCVHDVEL